MTDDMARREERTADNPDWGEGIRGIVREELGMLGISVDKGLAWHGQSIAVGQTLVLSAAQKAWAIVLGVAALLAFLATFAQGWAAAFTWMCQVGWIDTWCTVRG
jgi:hypothetical protein